MNWLYPILFPLAAAAVAIVGLLIFRKRVHHSNLSKHNDAAGAVFSIVGTLLTVLLAFIVVIVWESMETADHLAALEAGVLGDTIRDAGLFPEPERAELRNELLEYSQAVIEEEWPAMERSQSSPHVKKVLDQIFETFARIEPKTPREINIHIEMLRGINELSDHRRLRLLSADNKV